MGYMGFGMQKWIYKQRPRKPFSTARKKSNDTIIRNKRDSFVLVNRDKSFFISGFVRFLLGIVIVLAFIFSIKKLLTTYPTSNYYYNHQVIKQEALNLHFEYADYYMQNKDYGFASIEYLNILDKYPNNEKAIKGASKSLYLDCVIYNYNCNKAIDFFNQIIENQPTSNYYKMRADLFLHTNQTALALQDFEILSTFNSK